MMRPCVVGNELNDSFCLLIESFLLLKLLLVVAYGHLMRISRLNQQPLRIAT
jgi:hypothetical protein